MLSAQYDEENDKLKTLLFGQVDIFEKKRVKLEKIMEKVNPPEPPKKEEKGPKEGPADLAVLAELVEPLIIDVRDPSEVEAGKGGPPSFIQGSINVSHLVMF